jgi:hypothetical protein
VYVGQDNHAHAFRRIVRRDDFWRVTFWRARTNVDPVISSQKVRKTIRV